MTVSMTGGPAFAPRAGARSTSTPARIFVLLAIGAIVLGGVTACGKRPGDVLPPESVQDSDPFPRSYPSS